MQERELQGRLSSEVNATRVPAAKLVKAFNQLPMKSLAAPIPAQGRRRVVFISSNHAIASSTVAKLSEAIGFAPIEPNSVRLLKAVD